MAIVKMKLIKAAGSLDKLDSFIEACYMSGEFQPENASGFLSAAMGFLPLSEENPYTAKVRKIEELADVLGVTLKPHAINPGYVLESSDSVYIGEFGTTLSRLHNARRELLEQRELCEKGIEQYNHFSGLDVSLDEIFACEFIKVRFGHMPKESYEKLLKYEDSPYSLFIPCSTDETDYWGVYFAPIHKSAEVDRIFSLLYFERIHIPGAAGPVSEIIEQLRVNLNILHTQLEDLDNSLSHYWDDNGQKITEIYSRLRWFDQAFELRRYAAFRKNQFYYFGWLPVHNLKKFQSLVGRIQDVNCEITDPEKRVKTVPVKIRNNRLVRPFEYFVSMYGLPSYGSTDITAFVAVTYTLLFGMMFGDAGQGLVLMLAGFFMWKLKKMPLGKILIPCGLSSVFFGTLFGSFFGFEEALNPLYNAIGLAGKPLSVMDSINTVLLYSIGIGVFLVVVSMLINVYSCIKKKHIGEALFSNNGITGIVFYVFGVLAAAGFMSGRAFVPGKLTFAVMLIAGILLFQKEILIKIIDEKHYEKTGSVSDFILQNLFELVEYLLSYFSNTVSFLRVGAFVLVHAGMMMVVFSLAGESRNLFVILLGNALVIALEGLLTGIQALRLEFYEMFSRFLEGNGRPFVAAGPAVSNTQK